LDVSYKVQYWFFRPQHHTYEDVERLGSQMKNCVNVSPEVLVFCGCSSDDPFIDSFLSMLTYAPADVDDVIQKCDVYVEFVMR
jgi:hypothetical protein